LVDVHWGLCDEAVSPAKRSLDNALGVALNYAGVGTALAAVAHGLRTVAARPNDRVIAQVNAALMSTEMISHELCDDLSITLSAAGERKSPMPSSTFMSEQDSPKTQWSQSLSSHPSPMDTCRLINLSLV